MQKWLNGLIVVSSIALYGCAGAGSTTSGAQQRQLQSLQICCIEHKTMLLRILSRQFAQQLHMRSSHQLNSVVNLRKNCNRHVDK